jgi:hypothetical protein
MGAFAFLLLLATAPFVIKDGLLTPAGAHSTGFFYALVPLAIAVSGKGPPGFWRGLAAGLSLAVGTWYMRSAVAAGPALAIALLPGGPRALAGMTLGVLTFPALCAGDSALLTRPGGPLAYRGFELVFSEMLGAIRAESMTPDYAGKAMEAIGADARPWMFAQPFSPPEVTDIPHRAIFRWAGRVWFLGWMIGAGLLAALAALRGPEEAPRRPLWGAAVVLALAGAYAATYVISPFRIDPGLIGPPIDGDVFAPGLSGPRYLIPVYLGWTMALAGAVGLAWTNRWTRILSLGVLWVVFSGFLTMRLDLQRYTEPAHFWDELRPFDYHRVWGLGRGPPLEVHVRCADPDPISRSNHLRVMGWHYIGDARALVDDPEYLSGRIQDFQDNWGKLSAADLPFFVQGAGQAIGDGMAGTDNLPVEQLFNGAFRSAATIGPELGEVFLAGFAQTIAWDVVGGDPRPTVKLLCRETAWGTRPFCPVVGGLFASTDIVQAANSGELLAGFPAELLVGPHAADIVRGAAIQLRRVSPWIRTTARASWQADLLAAFDEGWAEEDARQRWKIGDEPRPEWVP